LNGKSTFHIVHRFTNGTAGGRTHRGNQKRGPHKRGKKTPKDQRVTLAGKRKQSHPGGEGQITGKKKKISQVRSPLKSYPQKGKEGKGRTLPNAIFCMKDGEENSKVNEARGGREKSREGVTTGKLGNYQLHRETERGECETMGDAGPWR